MDNEIIYKYKPTNSYYNRFIHIIYNSQCKPSIFILCMIYYILLSQIRNIYNKITNTSPK